jgi:hypothetical protein
VSTDVLNESAAIKASSAEFGLAVRELQAAVHINNAQATQKRGFGIDLFWPDWGNKTVILANNSVRNA